MYINVRCQMYVNLINVCRRGDDYQDDPMMVEFNKMDKDRQNPPEELQSKI